MSKELNCTNCCIGDFKESLCDCNNGICKEYKKVGKSEDFENEVLKRTKPKEETREADRPKGEWIDTGGDSWVCSNCGVESYVDEDFRVVDKRAYKMNFCHYCGARMTSNLKSGFESADVVQGWNNHEVACMLAELFGDACACNYNGIDEWLPFVCDLKDSCPNTVGVACWEQFLKHYRERREP